MAAAVLLVVAALVVCGPPPPPLLPLPALPCYLWNLGAVQFDLFSFVKVVPPLGKLHLRSLVCRGANEVIFCFSAGIEGASSRDLELICPGSCSYPLLPKGSQPYHGSAIFPFIYLFFMPFLLRELQNSGQANRKKNEPTFFLSFLNPI